MSEDLEGIVQVYVAGASVAPERARRFMDLVDAHKYTTVIQDWTAPIAEHRDRGVPDHQLDPTMRGHWSGQDLDAVAGCEIFVMLPEPRLPSKGAWVELGYALGLRVERLRREGAGWPYIIVAGGERRSIFTADHWPVSDYVPTGRLPLVDVEIAKPEPACDHEAFGYVVDKARLILSDRARK